MTGDTGLPPQRRSLIQSRIALWHSTVGGNLPTTIWSGAAFVELRSGRLAAMRRKKWGATQEGGWTQVRPEESRVRARGQSCRAEREVRHRSRPGLVGATERLALLSSGLWLKEG